MVQEIQMPKLGQTMEEGTVETWLVKEGEEVKKGEPLFEVTTDKATLEVEAFVTGTLLKIVVDEGEEVPAIGIVPETSISNGFALQNVNKNRLRGCCPKDILEIGSYTMSSIPVFEGGSDLYILERK